MQYLRVKNIERYQHYGKRNPPWIKLYRSLIGDYDLRQLSIPARYCYVGCLILASETDNHIPHDCKFIADRVGIDITELLLSELIDSKFLLASGARRLLAHERKSSSLLCPILINPLNSSSDSDLKSKDCAEFDQFWSAYPRKVGKKKARQAWDKAKDKPDVWRMIEAIIRSQSSDQWLKDNGQFIPHPATWLNEGRWDDQVQARPMNTMDAFLARGETHDTNGVRQRLAVADHPTVGQGVSDTDPRTGRAQHG